MQYDIAFTIGCVALTVLFSFFIGAAAALWYVGWSPYSPINPVKDDPLDRTLIQVAKSYSSMGMRHPPRNCKEYWQECAALRGRIKPEYYTIILGIDRENQHAMVFAVPDSVITDLFHCGEGDLFSGKHGTHYDPTSKVFHCPDELENKSSLYPDGAKYHIVLFNGDYGMKPRSIHDYRKDVAERCQDFWYIGVTPLSLIGTRLQAFMIVASDGYRYKLTISDCLEFAKEFARRSVYDLSDGEEDNEFFDNLVIIENKVVEQSERSSRQQPILGESAASAESSANKSLQF